MKHLKGTQHTVSPNLMLTLSTYSVVLHPSYLWRVRIMTGVFYRWDSSIFQYQTMCKSSTELGRIKHVTEITGTNKHLWNSVAAPENLTTSTVHITLGSLGSWTRLFFPHIQKHCLRAIFLEQVLCSAADDADGSATMVTSSIVTNRVKWN